MDKKMVEKAKQIITPQNLLIGLNIGGILAIVYFGMQLGSWKTKMEYMQDKVSRTESSVTIDGFSGYLYITIFRIVLVLVLLFLLSDFIV